MLVQGASSALGSLTASLARHLGGHVIAASRSAAKRQRLEGLHPDAVLDPAEPGFVQEIRALTGGRGADIVVDNLGEPGIWAASLAALAPGGALVSSGAFLGRDVTVDLPRLYLRGQRIIGVRTGNATSARAVWAEADRGFRPMVDATFALADAARAHRYLQDEQNVGRVALLVARQDPARRNGAYASTDC